MLPLNAQSILQGEVNPKTEVESSEVTCSRSHKRELTNIKSQEKDSIGKQKWKQVKENDENKAMISETREKN